MDPAPPTLSHLRSAVNGCPIIDNHAHNLLLPSHLDIHPFESITTEAQGRALRDTFKSLAHLRAVRQLRKLYECPENAVWEELLEQRAEWLRTNPDRLYKRCLEGIHAILIDDGLGKPEQFHPYDWHDQFTKAPSKRIVRIETLAERLMESILEDAVEEDLDSTRYLADIFVTFTEEFEREIERASRDDNVAGFKTVICYRTGLDIEPDYSQAARKVGDPFERYVEKCVRKRKFRIERKALNDYLVLRTMEILSENLPRDGFSKPVQFHTGYGDNDINLLQSNPAYLQPLIESYPRVPFVLLHSAYPYTREAGYLASVYKHVYLDVGEVFPRVSRDGQLSILRQSLELVPGSKILYSTDGVWFPETYWLANQQFREALLELLTEYVNKGDLTPNQAIGLTKDIMFNNSNILYSLNYTLDFQETGEDDQKSLPWHPPNPASIPPSPLPSPLPPPPPQVPVSGVQIFDDFMKAHPNIKFVFVQWLDFMATVRLRILPIQEFERLVRGQSKLSMSQGNTGTLQNDHITPVVNPVGQIYIEPDLRSLRLAHDKSPQPSATVLSFWRDKDGRPVRECPRSNLSNLLSHLQTTHSTTLLLGFEIEVTFLRRISPSAPFSFSPDPPKTETSPSTTTYEPITQTHAWGTLSPQQYLNLPLLFEITTSLQDLGIPVLQFHAESGPGQYEFVLGPQEPLLAIDTLIQARQVIMQIAAKNGLRATLHPQPFPGVGTAAHAHISLVSPDLEKQFFVGGVLKHLPAICAFSMPEAESYDRVKDDQWTGGTWVAWGTQNRETPLRRVENGRWEVRCVDGFANMYLAVGAVVAAGLLGLKEGGQEFAEKDVTVNPSRLSEEERAYYGITQKMPTSLSDALEALARDSQLAEMLEGGLVADFLAMKKAEQEMLNEMPGSERRAWLIERY